MFGALQWVCQWSISGCVGGCVSGCVISMRSTLLAVLSVCDVQVIFNVTVTVTEVTEELITEGEGGYACVCVCVFAWSGVCHVHLAYHLQDHPSCPFL